MMALKIFLYAAAAIGWLGAFLHLTARMTDRERISLVEFGACVAVGVFGVLVAGRI